MFWYINLQGRCFLKRFWLVGKQSTSVVAGMDVFGKFFIVAWLFNNVTPRLPIFSFFSKFNWRTTLMQGFFKLWLVFQEISAFQENQFVLDKRWRHLKQVQFALNPKQKTYLFWCFILNYWPEVFFVSSFNVERQYHNITFDFWKWHS